MRVLIERSAQEADALAFLLAAEGHEAVTVVGPELIAADGDVAYLDVWTPETAPHVTALREGGVRVTCASELVLERAARAGARTVGVTGSAGKTTTASLAAQLLRAAGMRVHATESGPLGQLWVTEELVDALPSLEAGDVVVAELTSSHLAFMSSSPAVAVLTCFWPDHVELHGSVDAYRRAKETIVRGQTPADAVVVPRDEEGARFARLTPARRFEFPAAGGDGAFVREGSVWLRCDRREIELGAPPGGAVAAHSALAAAAAAVAAGAPPERLAGLAPALRLPAHRQQQVDGTGAVVVVDDGMAVTPAKARAALAGRAAGSVVLIAGGRLDTPGGAAHASAGERAALDAFFDEAGRVVGLAVLYGAASAPLAAGLRACGVAVEPAEDIAGAVWRAVEESAGRTVVFAPVFPVTREDRERFAELARAAAAGG